MSDSRIVDRYGARAEKTLRDIVDFGDLAANLVSRGKAAYDVDVQLRLAGEIIAYKLGEASARLPNLLTADHPEIPFGTVKGMRNVIAHDYHRTDHEVVWATLSRNVPVFIKQVRTMLG